MPTETACRDRGAWLALLPAAMLATGCGAPDASSEDNSFVPSADAVAARNRFEGRLRLVAQEPPAKFTVHRDDYNVVEEAGLALEQLPQLESEFLQVGDALVPVQRGSMASSHPYWEFILAPGRVWQEPGDGEDSRAAVPFALQEVNANCMHHGVLGFRFRSDSRISRARYQISSETCRYLKFDMQGALEAGYSPHAIAGREALASAYRAEQQGRLPRKSLADLAQDFPGADPAGFGHPDDVTSGHLTTWGVVVDGVHYAGGCPTRKGEYVDCEELLLPSYSLAKSIFAGFALMRLERLHPGIRHERVADYVPACDASGRWRDVSFEQLLDMSSGNYLSATDNEDEQALHAVEQFFLPSSHREKIDYACGHFPRRSAPGRQFVYRSSDTYILGAALSAYLGKLNGDGADLVGDLLLPDVWQKVGLGPALATVRRTRDEIAQPFAGYGLTLRADDLAKLAALLNPAGKLLEDLLDPAMTRAALQRDGQDRGLAASADGSLTYNNGFWALRMASLPGCQGEQFIPFMAGYGGIILALLPNGVSYYHVSDNDDFRFRRAIAEAANIRGYCDPAGPDHQSLNKGRAS